MNWPTLEFDKIKDTLATVHQWIQIVGKIRLKTMPWQNHSWHVPLYISPQGYTTQGIPYNNGVFQIEFDLEQHKLIISHSKTGSCSFKLQEMTVAEFYKKVFDNLQKMDIDVKINGKPNEMDPAIPFKENTINKTYNPEHAYDIWQAMLVSNNVFQNFRCDFIGKCSPVHLFWGAFDLAVTRFSGEDAPLHQGNVPNMPKSVMQEAYSKEVSSVGFWPGSENFPYTAYYAYAYPASNEFGLQKVEPKEAFYSKDMGEFLLKYEDVCKSEHPEDTLMSFLRSTYDAAANTSNWNREKLERKK